MDCPVTARPTVIVISDSLGDTACEVVLAVSGQFDEGAFCVLRLPKVTSVEQVKSFVGPRVDADHRDIAVFHTIVDPALRARVLDYLGMLHIRSVDLIGPTLAVLSSLIGAPPKGVAGVIHRTDDRYFHRIEAMEYFVEHDDGRGCDDLSGADIVLLGVSLYGLYSFNNQKDLLAQRVLDGASLDPLLFLCSITGYVVDSDVFSH